MIAVDTNILVYAYRTDFDNHDRAREALKFLVASGLAWGLPWPCLHEFFAVVTNPRTFVTPTSPAKAMSFIGELLRLHGARGLTETYHHLSLVDGLVSAAPSVKGGRIHDAKIAAICLGNGVTELWAADRDFSLFPRLKTRNPLVHRDH